MEQPSEAAVTTYVPDPDPVADYMNAIDQTETEYGAYSTELIDLYQGLGKSLMENGELEAARNAFHQGVQVIRVNSGPYSPEQTNYLFSIADIESAMGEWKTADKVMNSIYMINARGYGEYDENMIPVLERMNKWYLNRRPLNGPYVLYEDMQRSGALVNKMAEILEHNKGLADPDTAAAYRRIGQIEFMTVQYVLSKGISLEPGLVISTGNPSMLGDIQEVSINHHFREGTEAFNKYIESMSLMEDTTPVEMAEALAQEGDWFLVFQRLDSAGDMYQQAYDMLAEGDGSNPVGDIYFSEPTPVRFMRDSEFEEFLDPDDPDAEYLEVSMTVTRGGDVRNIEVVNAPDSLSKDQLQTIKRKLDQTRFRPRLVNGEPERVKDFVWRHPLPQPVMLP